MHNVYIGIGTNIEPRSERMQQAIKTLREMGQIEKQSSIYETAPYGFTEQPDFLNAVVLLRTPLEITALHKSLRQRERELGRTDRPRWHEREIDFDILFYDDVVIHSKDLIVPHPELQNRVFVLMPMAEIAPDLLHPVLQKNISFLLDELSFEAGSIHALES